MEWRHSTEARYFHSVVLQPTSVIREDSIIVLDDTEVLVCGSKKMRTIGGSKASILLFITE